MSALSKLLIFEKYCSQVLRVTYSAIGYCNSGHYNLRLVAWTSSPAWGRSPQCQGYTVYSSYRRNFGEQIYDSMSVGYTVSSQCRPQTQWHCREKESWPNHPEINRGQKRGESVDCGVFGSQRIEIIEMKGGISSNAQWQS
ncbi:uncharacterized protein LOC112565604 [Pomacea canaliculata]|uniref:uncharacterized protein LOC112565604 n=1 Tax=Pomacea canaliculata TaxID=400727 RepID=UPI000D726A0F|nr:uncharacterized protein LOC112565604 [Pomacea canaliculata]